MPKVPKIDYLKCSQCRKDRQKCLPKGRKWPDRCERCEKYNYRCSENQTKKEEVEGVRHTYGASGDTSANICNYTNTIGSAQYHTTSCGNRQTHTGIASSILQYPPATGSLSERPPDATGQEDESPISRAPLSVPGFFGGSKSNEGGSSDRTLSQLMEELGYLKWLWNWLEPMAQRLEVLRTILWIDCDAIWVNFLDEHPKLRKVTNFIKRFKSVYQDVIHDATTLAIESDEWLGFSPIETLGECLLSCHSAFQPGSDQLSFLTRRSAFYESKGDFLAAQYNQERLLATLAKNTKGKTDNQTTKAARRLIELYNKTLDKLRTIALRLDLNVEMCLKVAPLVHQAVAQDNAALVLIFLSEHSPLDRQCGELDKLDILGQTAIHCAVRGHATSSLRTIISVHGEASKADSLDMLRWTALQVAAEEGHLDVVKLLIQHGAEINAKPASDSGRTALQAAAEGGHLDVVKLLIQHGAEINAEPAYWGGGRTALQAAAEGGHLDVVELLIQHGAEINAKPVNSGGRTALQAAAGGGHLDVVKLLIQHGAEINAKPVNSGGRTALQAAAGREHLDVVKYLLSLQNIDLPSLSPLDQLHYSPVIMELLRNAISSNWWTSMLPIMLHRSAEAEYIEIIDR